MSLISALLEDALKPSIQYRNYRSILV